MARYLLISLLLTGAAGGADRFVLVENGEARAAIVLAAGAPESVREAARELRDAVRKQTGAELPILSEDEADAGRPLVVLGDNRFSRALGFDPAVLAPEETVIAATPDRLVLFGADEPDAALENLRGHSWCDRIYFLRTGTLRAVYRLLEDFGGFRWYWPGDLGEVYAERPGFAVPAGEYVHRPSMRFRAMFAYEYLPASLWHWPRRDVYKVDYPTLPREDTLRWGRRLRQGGMPYTSNHNQDSFHARFGEAHPEWFANGSPRTGNQLCYSNPGVFEQVLRDARAFFDEGSDVNRWNIGDYFSVMPSDTAAWCACDACRPWFREENRSTEFSNGYASDYVWAFVVKVASELRKTHPGKFIACCAYWEYFLPPAFAIPDNVAVTICRERHRLYDEDVRALIADATRAWREKTDNLFFWDYFLFPATPVFDAFPQVDPRRLAVERAEMRDLDITGGIMMQMDEVFLRNVVLEHLRIYVNMRLMNDGVVDVDALLDEYYRLFYGPAEEPMRRFWDGLEATYYGPRPPSGEYAGSEYDWHVLCPPENVADFGALLDEAMARAPEGSPYARRVALVREGVFEPVLRASSEIVLRQSRERKTLVIRTVAPFAVDGDPEKEPWRSLGRAEGWSGLEGGPAQRPTYAQAAHDGENLYALFVCGEEPGYTPAPESLVYGAQPHYDDSVELFVDVGRRLGTSGYYQIIANTVPALYEEAVGFPDTPGWRSGARVVSRARDGGWVVEMAVPLASLGVDRIKPGDVWGLNFCRNLSEKAVHGFGSRFMHWSGPYGYRNPRRFGVAVFE